MIDFTTSYIKDSDKSPGQRIMDAATSSVRASATLSSATSITHYSQTLLQNGTSAANAGDIISQGVDDLAADSGPYSTNVNPARAAAEDINRTRLSGVYDAKDFTPSSKVARSKSAFDKTIVYALDDLLPIEGKDAQVLPCMSIGFAEYQRPNPFEEAKWTSNYTIVLPLPTELTDLSASRWSGSDLRSVGDIANLIGAPSVDGVSSTLGAMALNASKDIINTAGTLVKKRIAFAPLQAVGSAVASSSEEIATVLQQSLGVAPNPNPSMTFQGPQLRQYTYSWMFHPNSADESKRLKEIINELKKRSLPSTYIGTNTALLKYPEMCKIKVYPVDVDGNELIKYKKSVITSVNVNYSPNGVPSFFGDTRMPVFISLSISFNEIEFFTAKDYGHAGGDTTVQNLSNLVSKTMEFGKGVYQTVENIIADNEAILTPAFTPGDQTEGEQQ